MTRALDPAGAEQALMSVFSPEGYVDPYPAYARLRELDPVHYSETLRMWVLTCYDDCQQTLVDGDVFGVIDYDWITDNRPDLRRSYASRRVYDLLPFQNPPRHTWLRRLLTRGFTARRVEAMRPAVRRAVARVLDDLWDRGGGGTVVDFQEVVSFPLALAVVGDLLGIPASDRPNFPRLSNAIAPLVDPAVSHAAIDAADAAAREYFGYIERLIEQRRVTPGDDLTFELLAAHENDAERLSESELAEAIFLLFSAGFETTATVLGNGLLGMLTDRAQFALLAKDPSLISTATPEVLRWGASVHMQKRRVMQDTAIDGIAVPAGALVLPLLGAANRDPARFSDPDRFDITRDEGPALTFGGGIHLCLGAALVRLEISELMVELARRFPDIEVAGPVIVRQSANIRRLQSLPVLTGQPGRTIS
jgi:cytochrome P450